MIFDLGKIASPPQAHNDEVWRIRGAPWNRSLAGHDSRAKTRLCQEQPIESYDCFNSLESV